MLDHAGEQVVALEDDLVAVEVEAPHGDALGAHDLEAVAGHRQAPLVGERPRRRLDDLGVDDDRGTLALVQVEGEEPLAHPDLRRGEADAVFEVHGVVHAVHQGDEVGVEVLDLARALLQHGIAEESQRVHAPKLPARPSATVRPRGSTSIRSRPVGAGGVDGRRGEGVAQVGDRRGAQERPRPAPAATGPRTVTPAVGRRARTRPRPLPARR